MKRPPPFRLVPDSLSEDTVLCLRQLLTLAERGQVLGFAFVAIVKGRRFIRDAKGECLRNPVFSRGLIASLDDFLRERVRFY